MERYLAYFLLLNLCVCLLRHVEELMFTCDESGSSGNAGTGGDHGSKRMHHPHPIQCSAGMNHCPSNCSIPLSFQQRQQQAALMDAHARAAEGMDDEMNGDESENKDGSPLQVPCVALSFFIHVYKHLRHAMRSVW